MSEIPECDRCFPWEKDNDEYRMPDQVIMNFNSIYSEPHQPAKKPDCSVDNQSRSSNTENYYSPAPLFTERAKCMPLFQKMNIESEEDDGKRMYSSSANERGKRSKALMKMKTIFSQKPLPIIQTNISKKLSVISNGKTFSIIVALVTIYALFGDDIRILSVNQDGDDTFFILTTICMTFFTLEIIINCIANPDYLFNFYFWLDVISTVTMILDIGWITDSWYGEKGNIQNAATLKALGKASRTARKAARVIRIIRLIRSIKFYKHARLQIEKEKQKKILQEILKQSSNLQYQRPNLVRISVLLSSRQKKAIKPEEQKQIHSQIPGLIELQSSNIDKGSSNNIPFTNNDQVKESNVGSLLSDLVMRRAITIILSILISIPLLSLDTFQEIISSYDSGLFRISQFRQNALITPMLVEQYVKFHNNEIYPIQSVCVLHIDSEKYQQFNYTSNPDWFQQTSLQKDEYRFSDQQYYITTDENNILITYSVADLVQYNLTNALLSIFQTIFVCLVLALSAVLFNKDVIDLVIEPIESMIQKIEMIAANPLEAAKIEEQEELIIQELEKNQDVKKLYQRKLEQSMETYQLQKIIVKIGSLLAVGFGEAGSNIIAENIKKSGAVDPVVVGKKILAIFGFCNIRNFIDVTEVLQENVMLFVNEIAEIVHSTVDVHGGSINKNIGDSFLLIWKYPQSKFHYDPDDDKLLVLSEDNGTKQFGDMAVLAFLKIIISVSTSKKLEKYKLNQRLKERIKDYQVRMGFGLHMGWGIEGAIGSQFKIDASYLSPNVNLASRLEAATEQFGVNILISGVLKKHLTQICSSYLRLIDVVTVKGSIEPVSLYTVDLSIKKLQDKFPETKDIYDLSQVCQQKQKQIRLIQRFKRDILIKSLEEDKIQISEFFEKDEELLAAREPFTQQFYDLWIEGFNHYIRGEWLEAESIFLQTLSMIPDYKDGPSNTLLQVIRSKAGMAPRNWKGFRELTDK